MILSLKKHLALRNTHDEDAFKNSDAIKDIETQYKNFSRLIDFSVQLIKPYNKDSENDNVDHDCIETFIENDLNNEYQTFGELHNEINELQIKNSGFSKQQKRPDSNLEIKI